MRTQDGPLTFSGVPCVITRYSYNGGRNAECVCSCGETVCRSSEQASPHTLRHNAHFAADPERSNR